MVDKVSDTPAGSKAVPPQADSGDETQASAAQPGDKATSTDVQPPVTNLQVVPGPEALADQKAIAVDPVKANAAEVALGNLPDVGFASPEVIVAQAEVPKVTEQPRETDKPLTPEERYFTDFFQKRFGELDLLARITPVPEAKPGQTQADATLEFQKLLEERAKAIKLEMGQQDSTGATWLKSPEFGPATRAAYQDYVRWLEKTEIPGKVLALQSAGQPIPFGNPIGVPVENGQPISVGEYQNRIATGRLSADLGVDVTKAPTMGPAQALESALDWRNRAQTVVDQTMVKRWDDQIAETITALGLPEGWQYQPGQDKQAWRESVSRMIDLTERVGRMANLVDKLKVPVNLPPGATVTTGKNGSNVSLDLPQDLRMNDPATAQRVRQLLQWEAEVTPKLDEVRAQLKVVADNPNLALAWGDTTIYKVKDAQGHEVSAQVRFDKEGRLIGVVDPTKVKPQPGETFQEANLLSQRFTARTDPKTGEIVVNQDVQAQQAPWWSYENLIYDNIGKPAALPERRFKPDDLVAVNKGSGTEFMLAKDLEGWERSAAFFHYGEKALMATMDVAMIATGTIELGIAFKGARLLAATAEISGAVTRREVMMSAAKGTWETTLGLGGVTTSAELQSSTWGRHLSEARNMAFMGTIFYGVAASRFPAMNFSAREAKAVTTSEEALVAQRAKAAEGVEAPKFGVDDIVAKPKQPIEPVRYADGAIRSTTDGAGLTRSFEYVKDAQGNNLVQKIISGEGSQQVIIERSATGENLWNVRRADGTESTMQASVKVSDDGSYTVSYVTDESATWYKNAYHDGPPQTPLVREVKYAPDGTVTSTLPSNFKPVEGSTYHKEGRLGEYFTAPNGQKTWIDGENRIWNQASPGVWQSKDGFLTENVEYVKRDITYAERIEQPLPWTDVHNGQRFDSVAMPGDFKIMNPDGTFYCPSASFFLRHYEPVPGVPNAWIKKPIRAREVTEPTPVQTKSGVKMANEGDYVVTGMDGAVYPVTKDEFLRLYKRTPEAEQAAPTQFKLPEITGEPVHRPDGTTSMSYAGGEVIWSQNGKTVTITDSVKGTAQTYSGSDVVNAGVHFRFNNGAEERIMSSGLRFHRTKDMPAGEFIGEDGAILRDVVRRETSPLVASDKTPSSFVNVTPKDSLPSYPGELPVFARTTEGAQVDVVGRASRVTPYGTEWTEQNSSYLVDSRSRVWKKDAEGQWSNANGTFKVDEKGQRWTWKDGTADWIDADGRAWSRTADMPPGSWRTADGATYQDGTWQFTKRTMDDPHTAAVLAGLRTGAVVAIGQPGVAAASSTAPNTDVSAGVRGIPRSATEQAISEYAGKAMLYATYPVVGQQIHGITIMSKELAGQVLQNMGFQLDRMWAPTNPYMVAHAIQDYDQTKALGRINELDSNPRLAWRMDGIQVDNEKTALDTIAKYKADFLNSMPYSWSLFSTPRDKVESIFDKLSHAVSSAGTAEERAALKAELAANVTFEPWEIEQLDIANQGKLTRQEILDLWDPEKRARLKNRDLAEYAKQFIEWKDPNIVAASATALLYLSRQTEITTSTTVAAVDRRVYGPYDNGRTERLALSHEYLVNSLKTNLMTMEGDRRGIAIGDLLVKNGAIAPQAYGSILQNVLNSPSATAADKMNALSDATGPRMAALVGGLILKDIQSANLGLTNEQIMTLDAKSFGSTRQDFMRTLQNTATKDADPCVRAMSAAMHYALTRLAQNPEEGAKFLDRINELRTLAGGAGQAQLTAQIVSLLSSEVTNSAPENVQRRIDAAESLSFLAQSSPDPTATKDLQTNVSLSLAQSMQFANTVEAGRIASMMTPDRLALLEQARPQLAESFRQSVLKQLAVPSDISVPTQASLINVLTKLPDLLKGASTETREQAFSTIKNLVDKLPPEFEQVRLSAINSLGALDLQTAIPMLQDLVQAERSTAARLAALKSLEQLKDSKLLDLTNSLLSGELNNSNDNQQGDIALFAHLRDLKYRLERNVVSDSPAIVPSTDFKLFQSDIKTRYPRLNDFNSEAQKTYLQQTFPLLVRQNFNQAIADAVKGKLVGGFFDQTQKASEAVAALRDEQFKQLVAQARGDASSETTQKARQLLQSIITQENSGTIGKAEKLFVGDWYVSNGGYGATPIPMHYQEPTRDWAADAADALALTANLGNTGRDLSASLIGDALNSPVKGPIREKLLSAWRKLGETGNNAAIVPQSLYELILG